MSKVRNGAAMLLAVGSLAVPGITGAADAATPVAAPATAAVAPASIAPSCVAFTQYPHGQHTNVYIDNNCSYRVRVKVVMRHGRDSGCIQLFPGAQNAGFNSESDDFKTPFVDRIENC